MPLRFPAWLSRSPSLRHLFAVAVTAALGVAASPVGVARAAAARPARPSDVQYPLTTKGRYIVDSQGQRVKLKGVNWYGASDS